MQADNKVVNVSLSEVPAVALYERDRGCNIAVLYLLVRTDYGESEEDALKRARRVSQALTDDTARKKSKRRDDV